MEDRDEKILKHIGLYHVSLRVVIEKLFFQGKTCDHVLQRLLEQHRIQACSGLPGGLSYYQLTLTEARKRSVPEHRARKHNTAALREALAVLWFCCMSDKRRKRLERNQIGKIFGRGKGFGKPHCAEVRNEKENTIYRLYTPGPNSRDDYLIKLLRTDMQEAIDHPQLGPWLAAKAFQFAVTFETEARLKKFRRLLLREPPWAIQIRLELVPGLLELPREIRSHAEPSPTAKVKR